MRAKFRVNHVTTHSSSEISVNLTAVYQGSEENVSFWKYTPSGTIELSYCNPNAKDFFIPGEEYYIDFTLSNKEK